MSNRLASRCGRVAIVAAVLVLMLALVIIRPDVEGLAVYGYPGIFLTMTVSSATVLLPAPGWAVVLAASTFWNPVLVGLAAGLGAATGELTGFLLGYGGRAALEGRQSQMLARFEGWLRRYGFFALFGMAVVPNPFFDVIGVVAGSLGYPVWKFLIAVGLGNVIKYVVVSYLGSTAAQYLLNGHTLFGIGG